MPTTLNQIVVFLAFIIPGFVLARVKRMAYPTMEVATADTMLDSLALSCVIHALAAPVWYLTYIRGWYLTHPAVFALLALGILLLLPGLLGLVYIKGSSTKVGRAAREFLGLPHPDPTAWDYLFRKQRAYWIWLTFKSGKMMAGLFGPNSFASSFPQKRDLYVEKLLRLDEAGRVVELIEGSAGALVMMNDLERVEFFEIGDVNV